MKKGVSFIKNVVLLFSFASLFFGTLQAQENNEENEDETVFGDIDEEANEKPPLGERIYFGGNLGFQFGDITFIDASPLIGYRLTEKFSGGVGGTYRYLRNNNFPNANSLNVYGGRLFTRYDITPVVFPYAEYEMLNVKVGGSEVNNWFDALFIGVGFQQPLGRRGALTVLGLYNLSYDPLNNPLYNSEWQFRVGFIY